MESGGDRIAPNCTIRHPVRPIVALQRRMRFYARLAGFCRDRCHQRRARRAERASFSAFVSNPDFRVPRLRQIGWRAADRAVRRRKRRHPRGPESRPGLLRAMWKSIRTTNALENLNREFRRRTKTQASFTNEGVGCRLAIWRRRLWSNQATPHRRPPAPGRRARERCGRGLI